MEEEEDSSPIISRFQKYLQINTAHPKPLYQEAADFILSEANSLSLDSQTLEFVPGKLLILLKWPGSDPSLPSILLNSHTDVVPAEHEKWVHHPFSAHVDPSGKIYARGSQDMKCVGLQYLEAIRRLKASGFKPTRTVYLSFVPDEEIGGHDGAEKFAESDIFKALNVGIVLDEGLASPSEHYRAFYAERCPWWLIIKARSLPNLDFNDEDFPTKRTDRFMKFVGRVLSSRGSSDIRKICLHIHHCENFSTGDFSRVQRWIRAAIRHNIVELDLSLWFQYRKNDEFKMPLSLFKCKTLEVLSLHSNCITYPAATGGCFPCLKVLYVSDFDDDSMQKLFSHFPVLEELTIDAHLSFYNVLNIKISAPELKTLRILLDYPSNNYKRPNNIFINAPKLENLEVTDGVLTNYILESAKCPERTKIVYNDRCLIADDVCFRDKDDVFEDEAPRFTNRAAALLTKVHNVKFLSLDARPKCLEAWCVPALENLGKLELSLRDCYNWELLTELLKRSPKLEYLGLEHRNTSFDEWEIPECKWNPPEFVPICLSSSLKTICVKGFKGGQHEMEVAKYLLKYGEVLNAMIISTKNRFNRQDGHPYKTEEELCEEFRVCQKGSKICQVNLIYDAGSYFY